MSKNNEKKWSTARLQFQLNSRKRVLSPSMQYYAISSISLRVRLVGHMEYGVSWRNDNIHY